MIEVKVQEVNARGTIEDACWTVEDVFFSNRVIKRWNQLDQEAVDVTSINAFKSKLDRLRYTRMGFFMDHSSEP